MHTSQGLPDRRENSPSLRQLCNRGGCIRPATHVFTESDGSRSLNCEACCLEFYADEPGSRYEPIPPRQRDAVKIAESAEVTDE